MSKKSNIFRILVLTVVIIGVLVACGAQPTPDTAALDAAEEKAAAAQATADAAEKALAEAEEGSAEELAQAQKAVEEAEAAAAAAKAEAEAAKEQAEAAKAEAEEAMAETEEEAPAEGGVTIRYAARPEMAELMMKYLQPWADEKGYTIDVAGFGHQELTDKIMQSAATGTYMADVFQFPSQIRGDVIAAGGLATVPDEVLENVDYDDILPIFAKTLEWDGEVVSLPYDGDIHYYAFRKDLLEDPDNQAKFKEQYGYDLPGPETGAETWEQYQDMAEFFTGWDWNGNGEEDDFGQAAMTMRGDTMWWGFFSRASAYAKHPDDPGFFFDTETGEARINNPGFVRALEEWKVENEQWAPPGGIGFTYGDSYMAMNGGRAAQTYNWDAVAGAASAEDSVIQGLQGYNILPGSYEVWNSKTGEWDTFDEPSHAPFHAFGGWVFAVSSMADPEAQEAAWEMVEFLALPETSLPLVTSRTGASPYRISQLEDVDAFANGELALGEEVAADYLDTAMRTLNHPNAVFDLAIPGFTQYRDALELGVSQAMAGELSAQEALDQVAEEWNAVSERMGGMERQAEIYRKTLGVE